MRWNDVELKTREQWGLALARLATPEEARAFLDAYRAEQPEHAEAIVGYLTGEVHPRHRRRVNDLLGVEHPFHPEGKSAPEIFLEGYARDRWPIWMGAVMAIPREGAVDDYSVLADPR